MRVADVVLEVLSAHGVHDVFGVSELTTIRMNRGRPWSFSSSTLAEKEKCESKPKPRPKSMVVAI